MMLFSHCRDGTETFQKRCFNFSFLRRVNVSGMSFLESLSNLRRKTLKERCMKMLMQHLLTVAKVGQTLIKCFSNARPDIK